MITFLPCYQQSGKTTFIANLCRITERSLLLVHSSIRSMSEISTDFRIPSSRILLPRDNEFRSISHDVIIFVDELGHFTREIQERLHQMPNQVFAVGDPESSRLIGPVNEQIIDNRRNELENLVPEFPMQLDSSRIAPPQRRGRRDRFEYRRPVEKKAVKNETKKMTRFDMLELE